MITLFGDALSSLHSLLASIAPNLYFPFDFSKPEWFSGDPDVQQETREDKYMWQGSPRFGHALKILDAVDKVSIEDDDVLNEANFYDWQPVKSKLKTSYEE